MSIDWEHHVVGLQPLAAARSKVTSRGWIRLGGAIHSLDSSMAATTIAAALLMQLQLPAVSLYMSNVCMRVVHEHCVHVHCVRKVPQKQCACIASSGQLSQQQSCKCLAATATTRCGPLYY